MMVICLKCNNENPDDAVFCGFCGAKQEAAPAPEAAQTVYGYEVDQEKLMGAVGQLAPVPDDEPAQVDEAPVPEAAPEPEPTPEPEPEAAPDDVAADEAETIPARTMSVDDLSETIPVGSGPETIAGKYQLGGVMEELPVGCIYQATAEAGGGEVALLLVNDNIFPSPLDMERARRELHQLVKVDCPNIVKILDYGKTDAGQLYMVMEPTRFTPLDVLVATGGPMEIGDAQYLIKSIGNGLAEAQKIGVIHRDIGPHNVVVDRDGTVKVRGFGVAPNLKPKVFGTAEYVSPEQAQGRPVDQRSNIYSLGALMFYVLTGEPPFSDPDIESLLTKHQKEPPKSPKSRRPDLALSNKAEALVLKALAKSSSRRHLTLRQFLREVEGIKLESGTAAGQDTLTVRYEQAEGGEVSAERVADTLREIPEDAMAGDDGIDPTAKTMMDMPAMRPPAEPPPVEEEPPPVEEEPPPVVAEPPMADTVPEPEPPAAVAALLAADKAEKEAAAAPQPEPVPEPVPEPTPEPQPKPALEPVPEPAPVAAPAEPEAGSARGELQSETTLKKPDPAQAKPKKKQSGSAAGPVVPQRKGFRETMWFVKGEEESDQAEQADGEEEGGPEKKEEPKEGEEESKKSSALAGEETPEELAEKYTDDGSIGSEGSHHLSLRTGKTQQMRAIQMPSGEVPGEQMDETDFLDEMNPGRKYLIWIGIGVAIAAVVGIVVAVL